MSKIAINDLSQVENEFAELSDLELESVIGGKRVRDYSIDWDGDGLLDKTVYKKKTGRIIKIKFGRGQWGYA